jgi:drug/metabolite transporter (DMT)-like permease
MPLLFEANAVLGLLAAALWGGGDFAGSIAVKRFGGNVRGALIVVVVGHLLSLLVVGSLALTRGDTFPHGAPLVWAVCGGALSGISLVAFYIALADGHMGSAAAISGLLCAAVPAVVSGFTEGAPGYRRLLGFAFAGAAIWLIASASGPGDGASRKAIVLSTLGGIGFGVYFVSLKYAAISGVLWAMGTARIGSASAAALLLLAMLLTSSRRDNQAAVEPVRHGRTFAWIAAGAAMDTGGNLSFLAATRAGRLDVAAVLASIYPASTILLAAWLLKEHTTARQRWGMALAMVAVVFVTL